MIDDADKKASFDSAPQSIPVYREEVQIDKERVQTGKVHIKRQTITRQVPVSVLLENQKASVEVLPIGKYVSDIPQSVTDEDIMIIPVYEEHVEIIKRIYLKEEIRITTKKHESVFSQQTEVREQKIKIFRGKNEV